MKYLMLLFFMLLCVLDSNAQLAEQIQIHGFGSWAYGKTDNENSYLVGNEDGKYDYLDFALNISATPHENLSLHVQMDWSESSEENEVGLDYAFAEWFFSEALIFRIGKVKAPFMFYTEVYDVGTIRPFFMLPQGIYHDIAAEAYKGLGITGSLYTTGGWEIMYDLYGGKLELLPQHNFDPDNFVFVYTYPFTNDMIGGRAIVHTPIDGLNFAISAYTGKFGFMENDVVLENYALDDEYALIGLSGEYISDPFWLRGEYLTEKRSDGLELDITYFEAAYKFKEHWQVAARYEYEDMDFDVIATPFKHKDSVLGLNYWFNSNLVLKFSYHHVEENHFAYPEKVEGFLDGILDDKTNLILLGTQFSF